VRIVTGRDRLVTGFIAEVDRSTGTATIYTTFPATIDGSIVNVLVQDRTLYLGRVAGVDQIRDLAIVTICCSNTFASVPLALGRTTSSGDELFVMGYKNTSGEEASVALGRVAAASFDDERSRWVLTSNIPKHPGGAGWPMFTLDGAVLGITSLQGPEAHETGVLGQTLLELARPLLAGRVALVPTPTPTPWPTPTSIVTATPTATPTPIPTSGPFSGSLVHNQQAPAPPALLLNRTMLEGRLRATFQNPTYSTAIAAWDYGFYVHYRPGLYFAVVVTALSQWELYLVQPGSAGPHLLQREFIPSGAFSTAPGASNHLTLDFFAGYGVLSLNGQFVGQLDLSRMMLAGDVGIVTGFNPFFSLDGESTPYSDFTAGPF
jgi:hypothetical protein